MVAVSHTECDRCGARCIVKNDKGNWIIECPYCKKQREKKK